MKFKCTRCLDDKTSKKPCILIIKGMKKDNDRDNWMEALRRCPFENDINGTFAGVTPRANWRRVKK